MIRPVRYSGRSGRSSQASANISAGPTIQFSTREEISSRRSPVTVSEPVVADLGQHRVHHQQQPERDRQRDLADLDRVQRGAQAGHQAAEQQPGRHRHADPHRQEPIQRGQPADHARLCRSRRGGSPGM